MSFTKKVHCEQGINQLHLVGTLSNITDVSYVHYGESMNDENADLPLWQVGPEKQGGHTQLKSLVPRPVGTQLPPLAHGLTLHGFSGMEMYSGLCFVN